MKYLKKDDIVFENNIHKWMKIVGVIGFLFILTFIILLTSPINIFETKDIFTDQGVFETIGMMMQKGYMPYRDTFDHKGPLIYLYNFWGQQIEYYKGIWYLEFINLFITFGAIYKIARLKCNQLLSLFLVMVSTIALFAFFEQGNLVEEYALPFIAISLYIFLDYMLNQKVNKRRLITCGFSMGSVLLLRPNMISLWVVFGIIILIKCIKEKKYLELKEFITYFMLGLLIIIIPFMIWLFKNKALLDFWEQYIIFNFEYIKVSELGLGWPDKLKTFGFFMMQSLSLLSIIAVTILCVINKKKEDLFYLIYVLITLISISISGNRYNHYGIILLPISIYPLSSMLKHSDNYVHYATLCVSISLLLFLGFPNYYKIVKEIPEMYQNRHVNQVSTNIKNAVKIIEDNTSIDDPISVYGNKNILYVLSKRRHATKYSYLFPLVMISDEIKEDYFEQLAKEKPKILVVETFKRDEDMIKFITDYNYNQIYADQNYLEIYKLQEVGD